MQLQVHRLAGLSERQIKVRLGLDNVMSLLRASARDGPCAQAIQDICKEFFLANYNQCTELQECEALDPKLLCELMRLHNNRTNGGTFGVSRTSSGAVSAAGSLAPMMCAAPASFNQANSSVTDLATETLGSDLRRLFEERILPDFEVVVQDEVIHVHRFVLVARCRYFASCLLTSGMSEAKDGR